MAKVKNDYFKLIEEQFSHCVKAGELLEDIFCNFSKDTIVARMEEMHEVERAADRALRNISQNLSREFITPIDQSDIYRIANKLDDVTDWLDECVMNLHMYDMDEVPEYGLEMAKTANRGVKALAEAVKELRNFKKPEKLVERLLEVNGIESESDALLMTAVNHLFRTENDYKNLISGKILYESLEHCTDVCEHAADLIERVIIKNS